jgi:hypothetical protein
MPTMLRPLKWACFSDRFPAILFTLFIIRTNQKASWGHSRADRLMLIESEEPLKILTPPKVLDLFGYIQQSQKVATVPLN